MAPKRRQREDDSHQTGLGPTTEEMDLLLQKLTKVLRHLAAIAPGDVVALEAVAVNQLERRQRQQHDRFVRDWLHKPRSTNA